MVGTRIAREKQLRGPGFSATQLLDSLVCSSCELRTLAPILRGRSCDHAGLLLATQQRKLLSPDPTSDVCGRARLYVIRLSEEGSWGVARQHFYLISASMLNRHVPRVRQYQGRQADREARESQGGVLGLFRLLLTRSKGCKYCVLQCTEGLVSCPMPSLPRIW